MAEARVRGFSIATKCATVDELIEKFRDRVDDESILVNTVEAREVGTECAFAILLSDKKVALAGTCVVRDVYTDANNPFKRPGMRLAIKRLGPESQKVFAQLLAKRIAPRKMTQAIAVVAVPRTSTDSLPPVKPVIVMPRSAKAKTEAPRTKAIPDVVVPRTATQPIRGLRADSPALDVGREQPRRMPTVQIPPLEAVDEEPLARAPRATPFELETLAVLEEKERALAAQQQFEAKTEPLIAKQIEPPQPARVEERVPGSPYILPANPLTDVSDASLEGFVDCRLFEAKGALAEPNQFPIGTHDDDVADDEPAVIRDSLQPAALAEVAAAAAKAEVQERADMLEPLPLPPPPPTAGAQSEAPERPTPLPYAHTKLPDLNVPDANDDVRPPLLTRRVGLRLALAVVLLPLLGAAAVVAYVELVAGPVPAVTASVPPAVATIEVATSARVAVEPAPPAPVEPTLEVPATPQPIHAVFVQTYPIAARVTVGNRSFGTTPTYIKIPANTPVSVRMERSGFKPVVYPFVSKRPTDRVFVRLQRRGAR